jgi:protein gp37
MGKTNISWSDEVWNPTTGCSHVSPGCEHCYAETLSLRRGWSKKPWTAANAAENVVLHPDRLDQPLRWRKPRMVFVDSMSDLFHEQIPDEFVARVWDVMVRTPRHTYQVLTKRPKRMATVLGPDGIGFYSRNGPVPCPQPNVWLGTSIEDQRRADERIPLLLRTPTAVRWLSCEPLLAPIDGIYLEGISWVVVGGESGPGHRPMKIEWLESIVNQCREANVPVFVKQASALRPGQQGDIPDDLWALKQFPKILEVTA